MSGQIEGSNTSLINGYNIGTALSLLSAADYFPEEERGCLDSICTLINNIWITVKRVFHYIFSCDHQWYNNNTACAIITYYAHHYEENIDARNQVRELINALGYRTLNGGCCGDNDVSYAADLYNGPDGEAIMEVLYINVDNYLQEHNQDNHSGQGNSGNTIQLEDPQNIHTDQGNIQQPTSSRPAAHVDVPQIHADNLRYREVTVIRPGQPNEDDSSNTIGQFDPAPEEEHRTNVPAASQDQSYMNNPRIPLIRDFNATSFLNTVPLPVPPVPRTTPRRSTTAQVQPSRPAQPSADDTVRNYFQTGTTGNIALLARTRQMLQAESWEEISEILPAIEESLQTFKETVSINPDSQESTRLPPRLYDASNDANLPNIASDPSSAYSKVMDPYDLFQQALFCAAVELGISQTEITSSNFINSEKMMQACRLAMIYLLKQAALKTGCIDFVEFSAKLRACYQKPMVVKAPNAETGELEQRVFYESDILSSTEVGCDPVGAKRLLQNATEKNRLDELTKFIVLGRPSPEEIDQSRGDTPDESLKSNVLKTLIDTMAEQVKNRYGSKIVPMLVQDFLQQEPPASPGLNADFEIYTKGALTPFKLIEKAFIWSAQRQIDLGIVAEDDLDLAGFDAAGADYAKGLIARTAIFNLVKHAKPVNDFCIKLTDNVVAECGRFYAYEADADEPHVLKARERYIPNDFCGSGKDGDAGTDLIKAKKLMSQLSDEELVVAERYLNYDMVKQLCQLRGHEEQAEEYKRQADDAFASFSEEHRVLIQLLNRELTKIQYKVGVAHADDIINVAFNQSMDGIPGALKFPQDAQITIQPIREAPPPEAALIDQPVLLDFLPRELHNRITIKDRPIRTQGPLVPIRDMNQVRANRANPHLSAEEKRFNALKEQNDIIDQHPSNGNCLYGALALELFRGVTTNKNDLNRHATLLRQAVAKYIRENPEHFFVFMHRDEDRQQRGETTEAYERRLQGLLNSRLVERCDAIENSLAWAGDEELTAISCIFGVPIHVFDMKKQMTIGTEGIEDGVIQPNMKWGNTFKGAPIRLCLEYGVHYEPMRLKVALQ